MKNEFINNLEENEKILFHGVSNVSKTSKQYGRILLIFVILLIFWILLISSMQTENILSMKFLASLLALILLTIGSIYGTIYNMFFKYKNKNNEYFVTNKRIALYNQKKGFRIENISNIEHIGIAREKNNYGDISFNFYANSLAEQMKNGMSFEGIENPREIVALIASINNNIHIYDDIPTIMGEKM